MYSVLSQDNILGEVELELNHFTRIKHNCPGPVKDIATLQKWNRHFFVNALCPEKHLRDKFPDTFAILLKPISSKVMLTEFGVVKFILMHRFISKLALMK